MKMRVEKKSEKKKPCTQEFIKDKVRLAAKRKECPN